MSNERDNGGPAFPSMHSIDGNWVKDPRPEYCGMTLRVFFAANAPVEDVDHIMVVRGWNKYGGDLYVDAVTTARYMYADAMLKARNSTQP